MSDAPASSPPTLSELAAQLGLAKSTVSNALRGQGRVAPSTIARVREYARQAAYRPDPLLSALSARHANRDARGATIAAIAYDRGTWYDSQALADAEKLGLHVEPHFLRDYPSQTSLARVLRARGIAGLLFRETPVPLDLDPAVWSDFAGVYCGPFPGESCPFPVVRYNAFDAAALTWEKVREAGYRRIGLIAGHHGDQLSSLDRKTLSGFQMMQEQVPRSRRFPAMIKSIPKLPDSGASLREWLERYQPDAVIVNFAALQFLLKRVVALPSASTRIGTSSGQTIAGCLVNREHVEWEALCYLESRIRTTYAGRRHDLALVIEPKWQAGESLWPASPG